MDDQQGKSATHPTATTFHVEHPATATRRRPKVSYEEVAAACERMQAEGVKPSIAKLRREVGGGTEALSAHLASWNEAQRLGARISDGDGYSQELRVALAREMADQRARAVSDVQEQLAEALDAVKELTAELVAERAKVEERDAATEGLRHELAEATAEVQRVHSDTAAARLVLEGELKGARDQLAELQAKHSAASVAMAEQRCGAEYAAKEAAAFKQENQRLQKDLDAARGQLSTAVAAVAEERHKAAMAVEKLANQKQLVEIAQKATHEARSEAAKHGQRVRELEVSSDELRRQLDAARTQVLAAATARPDKSTQGGKAP